ncbi:MAG TPA: hypothetical protein P5228_09845 [Bacteroidales bacterium]|nr:hypothetical protein [Bacteroidales bacterium]HRZ49910.1 hypothetical protein [Bacteroidales bacterium]
MTEHPLIFIPVESKKRELDGKILLASALIARGWKVIIGTKAGIRREMLHHRNALYLAKSVSSDFIPFYREIQSLGHRMVALDVEGGALTREIRNDLLRSYQQDAVEYFDYIYVFGDKIKKDIAEHIPYIPQEKILVTGEPRFDLLKPVHDPYYAADIEHIRNTYGNCVLINTSFGLSNSVLGEEWIRQFLETTGDIPEEQRPLYLLKHREGKILMQEFIAMAKRLAERFPALNFVLRPHPDEAQEVYREAFAGILNLFVDGTGSVQPWIKSAKAVIHHDCTTGLEAVLAMKPTISYIPRTDERITAWLPVFVSVACTSENAVANALETALQQPESLSAPEKEKGDVLASYFANFREEASDMLADHLSVAYCQPSTGPFGLVRLSLARLRSRVNIVRLRNKSRKDGWDRFIRMDREELCKRLPLTGNLNDISALRISIRGGNTAYLQSLRKS